MKKPIKKKKKSFLKDKQKKGGKKVAATTEKKTVPAEQVEYLHQYTHKRNRVTSKHLVENEGICPKLNNLGLHAQLEHNAQVISTRV